MVSALMIAFDGCMDGNDGTIGRLFLIARLRFATLLYSSAGSNTMMQEEMMIQGH